ncbi:MAG: lipoyl synthase [candidate division KSB1 bacterium]|nr:lipoyl synthase [candidate division KSB1 bacterium]MDZ7339708.1 lipoyl synthase [candidate division KSB1 bacterium]
MPVVHKRHPRWLKVPLPAGKNFQDVRKLVEQHHLHTVCQSAHCPNIGDCWGKRTATFMILGDVCTRNCRFCAVASGMPGPVDLSEPERVAEAVKTLSLKYAVITSVTRDDLPDGGAAIFATTIQKIRTAVPSCQIEVLIPDFQGTFSAQMLVFAARPDVLNHNIETVPSLYPLVRPQADYWRSIRLLAAAKQAGLVTKTGLMLGVGETESEVIEVMQDLRQVQCDILTLGQYLQPSAAHAPIDRYVTPEEFNRLKAIGIELGFQHVEAGPLVRSSYHAGECFDRLAIEAD